ncbi:MAG: CotH kinase family protein [Ignavibacteriales bacterium]|nr:CotH kinase family protein [Ignavibacteriales bacterium]
MNIKKVFFWILIMAEINSSFGQNDESWKVYNDTEVAIIKITTSPESIQFMYENPQSDSMHLAQVHFKNSLIDEIIDSVGIRIRGNTSRESAKKSFKLSFNTFKDKGKFYSLEKINLNGEHNDPSIVRSKVCWDFFNNIGIVSSRAAHAAVYINEKYYGLYISVEQIDDEFIQKNFDDDSGNLWKCLYGADLTSINNAYTLTTNEEINDFSELDTLTKVINNTTISGFAHIIEEYFNVVDYLKIQAVDIIVGSWDNYSVLSNNYYLYHNPSEDMFYWIPYDYDNTFGIDWLGFDWANTNPYEFGHLLNQPRPLYNRLLQVPRYKNLLSHFIEFYLENYINSENFSSYLQSFKNRIEPFALADTFRVFDWGFTNDDFYNSYDALNYSKEPHVKYSMTEYLDLRRSSLLAQIDYLEMSPIVYNVNISNIFPMNDESIEINASVFSKTNINSVTANLTFSDGRIENVPFNFNPNLTSYKVEETENWTSILNPLGIDQTVNLKIVVQETKGNLTFYPENGIEIRTPGNLTQEVLLSELMSSNTITIQDNFGEYDDWLEIYNPQDTVVNLSGKYLTDKIDNLTKWKFPDNVKIQPRQHIIIWCDEDQEQAGAHINFKLSSLGEFVAIIDNDGITIVDSVTIPALNSDVSLSRENNIGNWFVTQTSTPGTSNIITDVDENIIKKDYKSNIAAYPNPFNPTTNITYEISKPMSIKLEIYDILGKRVKLIEEDKKNAGKYNSIWNGKDEYNNNLSSGIYFLKIKGESFNKTIKLMLLR